MAKLPSVRRQQERDDVMITNSFLTKIMRSSSARYESPGVMG